MKNLLIKGILNMALENVLEVISTKSFKGWNVNVRRDENQKIISVCFERE
jgi:hypothetical protein